MKSMYSKYHPYVDRNVDIFCLGMVFLTMLCRDKISIRKALWIKYQMTKCNEKECSPAHVLLYHQQTVDSYNVPTPRENYNYNRDVTDFDKLKFKTLQQAVHNELICKQICEMLHQMTQSNSKERPSISTCINTLQLSICKKLSGVN